MTSATRNKLIAVVFVLLLGTGLLAVTFDRAATAARSTKTRVQAGLVISTLQSYQKTFGPLDSLDLPQVLAQLMRTDAPKNSATAFSSTIDPAAFHDAWGHDFRFVRRADGNITVWSAGPNGVFEDSPGSDDIRVE